MPQTTEQQPRENKMGVMPVNKLLISMALPMMISMLVQALYNIVDSIFVARLSEDALTAVSMAFPMQNLLIGVASGIGVGTNALVSRSLGQKNYKEANRTAMHGIFLSAVAYLIFLVLGLTITRAFFRIQGAGARITEYGHEYLSCILIFSFGVFIQMMFERLLQSTGKTIYTMFTQGAGAIINIILDPIMIFGLLGCPKMGITGAAAATVIGQIIAGCMAFLFNAKKNEDVSLYLKGLKIEMSIVKNILVIGIPSVIMVAVGSVMTFFVDRLLIGFTSTAVAVFGVYFKLQSFAFMPVFGMNNGMVPIVAYNYGARKPERIKKTVRLATTYAMIIMVIAFAVFQIFTAQLLGFFNASEDMLKIGVPALRIMSISYLVAGYSVISSSYFQAMGNGVYSMFVSIARQLIFLLPLAFIFSLSGNLDLIWVAWPIAEVASVACCFVFRRRIYRKLIRPLYEDNEQ